MNCYKYWQGQYSPTTTTVSLDELCLAVQLFSCWNKSTENCLNDPPEPDCSLRKEEVKKKTCNFSKPLWLSILYGMKNLQKLWTPSRFISFLRLWRTILKASLHNKGFRGVRSCLAVMTDLTGLSLLNINTRPDCCVIFTRIILCSVT